MLDINALDLIDDLDNFAFECHLTMVYDGVSDVNDRHATSLFESARFWTKKFQLEWIEKQYVKLYLQIQKNCSGEARMQIEDLTHSRAREIREHFMLRFGGSQKSLIKARKKAFLAGMPAENSKVAFPQYCNMEDKLIQLETERTFFWKTCPIECRSTYVYCQESKMVHVILEHLPYDYDQAVEKVRNSVKMRKMVAGDSTAGVSTRTLFCQKRFWAPFRMRR